MNAAIESVLLLGILAPFAGARAQDVVKPSADGGAPSKDGTRSALAEAQRRELDGMKRSAASYRIATDAQPPRDLVLNEEPVLRWTNPVRDTTAGAIFVWLADGRPEVVTSVYRNPVEGKIVEEHEFQSLATTGLTATRDGQTVWVPQTAGIELAPIPGAPRPAATAAERLRQMGALAREFHAFFDGAEDKSELRLLPKPLFRYETKRRDVSDGALFAFVLTTDPEVLLLIESRPLAGIPTWHSGFARMSMVNLRAAHKDRNVWKVDWAFELRNPTKPYINIRAPDRSD
jgi:hypothetical protein